MKVAVIGVGHLGRIHARVYSQLQNVELVAVSDVSEEQGEKIANQLNTQYFADYKKLLDKVDAVSIATPTNFHYKIARDFLKAGVHVLIEKPITNTIEQAKELVDLAKKKNLKLQVGHSERCNPIIVALLKHKLTPLYIEANRSSPFRFRSGDVNVILDLMIHDIDIIINALVKDDVKSIDAVGGSIIGDKEDLANVRIVFNNNCVANITANRVALNMRRDLKIFTKDAYIEIDYAKKKGKIYTRNPEIPESDKLDLQTKQPEQFANLTFEEMFYGKMLCEQEIEIEEREPLNLQLDSFITAIKNDTAPLVSGVDGLKALKVVQNITLSMQEKCKSFGLL